MTCNYKKSQGLSLFGDLFSDGFPRSTVKFVDGTLVKVTTARTFFEFFDAKRKVADDKNPLSQYKNATEEKFYDMIYNLIATQQQNPYMKPEEPHVQFLDNFAGNVDANTKLVIWYKERK